MKKIAFLVFWALAVCGVSFAQGTPATSAVNGVLGLSGGRIVLKSADATYYTRGLERFIGFIDGLKDGAEAVVEGYVSPPSREGGAGSTERLLFPVKLTLNGKEYEVGPAFDETRKRQLSAFPGRNGRDRDRDSGRDRDKDAPRRHGCW
jgi:hypothetical protein